MTTQDVEFYRENYNWREAFSVSSELACEGYTGHLEACCAEDIAEVIAADEGQNDGDSWVGVFKMANGTYVFVDAWCDYTGWDCQAGGKIWVAGDLETLIQFGLTEQARSRLNLWETPAVEPDLDDGFPGYGGGSGHVMREKRWADRAKTDALLAEALKLRDAWRALRKGIACGEGKEDLWTKGVELERLSWSLLAMRYNELGGRP